MNEARFSAYLELLQALLACASGEENHILQVHQELLDEGFLSILAALSQQFQETGKQQEVEFLNNLSQHLIPRFRNKARYDAYLELLQALLACPNGGEPHILQAHQELLDEGFLGTLAAVSQQLQAAGSEREAAFLKHLSQDLTPLIQKVNTRNREIILGNTPITEADTKIYGQFISEVLQATAESNGDASLIYSLLAANTDKLNNIFAQLLHRWATNTLAEAEADTAISIAVVIGDFSNIIQQFSLGDKAHNIEIAITGYDITLNVYTHSAFPVDWAMMQHNLGIAYCERILGDRAENLEMAITAFTAALEVCTRSAFPQQWAMMQNNLGAAYGDRIFGEKAENLELAIAACAAALEVCTRSAFPQQWAMTQIHLSNAYSERIFGEKAENLELAITAYAVALEVFTRSTFPVDWAITQNNLGEAYRKRILGEKAENLELAIAAYTAALEVFTRSTFPVDWAMTQNNLGTAYCDRILGDRAENLELAIAACAAALEVRTRSAFPQKWAITQRSLGFAYSERILGEKAENLELAVTACAAALEVYTRSAFPQQWAITQNYLGEAYRKRILGEKAENLELAIAAYTAALEVFTGSTFPVDWAMMQNNLGLAYYKRILGEKAENLELAITAYTAALEVYTCNAFPQQWAITQNNLGNAYNERILGERAGNLELAIKSYQNALEIMTPETFPINCLQTGRNLGNLGFREGNWELAIQGYEVAIEAVETSRSWSISDQRRNEILAEAIDIYSNALQSYINLDQYQKAILLTERARSRHLVELMYSNDLYKNGEIDPQIQQYLNKYEQKQEQINQKHLEQQNYDKSKAINISTTSSQTDEEIKKYLEKLDEDLKNLYKEKEEIWLKIRNQDKVLAGMLKVPHLEFHTLEKLISNSPKTALLSFYSTSEHTYIFVLRQNDNATQNSSTISLSLHTCDNAGYDLQDLVANQWLFLYDQDIVTWAQPEQMEKTLQEISKKLQINDLIRNYLQNIEELILIPHIYLHLIPFAALPVNISPSTTNETKNEVTQPYPCLSDLFRLRFAPSAQILSYCQEREEQKPYPSLEGNKYATVENATDDLIAASYECEQIVQLLDIPPTQRLIGKQNATVSNYRQLTQKNPQLRGLHFSHHAASNLNNPLESALQLGDGRLTLGQLMSPGWRMRHLVEIFLSCCETNLGNPNITDDILTLATGFLCAGARSVISTLWSVNDLATAFFCLFYYQHRKAGHNRATALQLAQKDLRNKTGEELEKELSSIEKYLEKIQEDSEDEVYEKIENTINWIRHIQNRSSQKPFESPYYWAGFICQGL